MKAKMQSLHTPRLLGWGQKGIWGQKVKTIFFSESSHVAYQIKADDAGSKMVANILPTDLPSTQRAGSKGQTIFYSESRHFAYQIKEN